MDSNKYNTGTELAGSEVLFTSPDYEAMPLAELQMTIDGEILADTLRDILCIPPALRSAAVADFAAIDPVLGAKLRASLSLALS